MPSTRPGLLLMTGVSAGLGALTMANAATAAYAIILGLATGALPAVIVKAMLPEAQQPGLSTPAGGRRAVRLAGAG
jgi:zinc transporter ZupT